MNPTVAVVAQGAMGAGVGARLVERGLHRHHLARRAQRGERQARQGGRHGRGLRRRSARRPISSCRSARRARRMALAEKMAALIKPSNKKPIYVDCNAVSPPTKVEIGEVIAKVGRAVRRRRHHRIAAEGGLQPGRACLRSRRGEGRGAQRVRRQGQRDRRAGRRRVGAEDVVRRHHQGRHRGGVHDDAGRDARRRRGQAARRA